LKEDCVISITGLSRSYGDFKAVDQVSFSIEKGEVIGLLGHNGAGKTTIMKMLTGFLEPSAGSIEIDGLKMPEDRMAIQNRIGYLPENCPVYPDMTVIDYLEYAAELRGLIGPAILESVQRVIKQTELSSKATQPINTLSRGFRQRVGVAQAILGKPDILILDEPTNGLDPAQILHMRELITSLSQSATVIISTHILQEVQAVCDRVLIVKNGKLAVDAKINELQQGGSIKLISSNPLYQIEAAIKQQQGVKVLGGNTLANNQFDYALQAVDGKMNLQEAVPGLIKTLQDNNISIYGIYPERQDLESLFRQVNSISEPETREVAHAA
jgi:ABC-2 type transport system ATP-binding protein